MVMLSDTVHDITPTVSRRPDRKASRASLESNIFDLISSEFKTVAESGIVAHVAWKANEAVSEASACAPAAVTHAVTHPKQERHVCVRSTNSRARRAPNSHFDTLPPLPVRSQALRTVTIAPRAHAWLLDDPQQHSTMGVKDCNYCLQSRKAFSCFGRPVMARSAAEDLPVIERAQRAQQAVNQLAARARGRDATAARLELRIAKVHTATQPQTISVCVPNSVCVSNSVRIVCTQSIHRMHRSQLTRSSTVRIVWGVRRLR